MRRSFHKCGGFSLIEVALALLVVSVGLVAVIGMFPSGLDSGRKANEDTQTAIFADYVLNTIRACAANTNYLWSDFADGSKTLQIPIAAPGMWDSSMPNRTIYPGDVKKNITFLSSEDKNIEEFSINYSLFISDIASNRMKRVKLEIWPGMAGSTNNYRVYFTDIFRGDLK